MLFVSCAVVVVFATRVVAEGCVLEELQAVVRHHASCSFITTLILRPAILPWRYVFAKFSLSLSLLEFFSPFLSFFLALRIWLCFYCQNGEKEIFFFLWQYQKKRLGT